MGSNTSKLKKRLRCGDEDGVLQIFESSKDVQKGFDVNKSFGEKHSHDTALHFACRHAMKRTVRLFLFDRAGNPNKKNARQETCLHAACQSVSSSMDDPATREECVNMLLMWRGAKRSDKSADQVDLTAQDKMGNTALHYAASSGLDGCVRILVEKGAPIFTENNARQTPCELAEKASKFNIATYLESQMVFYDNDDQSESPSGEQTSGGGGGGGPEEDLPGMKPVDLLEAKDSLIVETCDMLRVPLFTAEVLLRNHEWSREVLLEAWIQDPRACCEKCGVDPPANLDEPTPSAGDYELDMSASVRPADAEVDSPPCEICYNEITTPADVVLTCEHSFCKGCWSDYLHIKIKEGDSHNIQCPAYGCHRLVPVAFIEKMVSNTMARRYMHFDIKAFVDSNPHIVWCPHPACGLAVPHPDRMRSASVSSQSSIHSRTATTAFSRLGASAPPPPLTIRCANGHSFCWSCQLEPPHEPATCEQYKLWLAKIAEVKREDFDEISKKSEAAANVFWMLNNSKKCPNCKSPIEKNEGCNHMRCSKCKHDFCWVCLEPWKYHNSMTGGFFRCTRYEVVEKVEGQQMSEMSGASERHKSLQELNRFIHYYSRYENHKRSQQIEMPLLDNIKQKLTQPATTSRTKLNAARFLEEAISVLIRARNVLQFGYVYGYYLTQTSTKKMVFELLQTDLEERTEYLSEMIARPYLRTPKSEIMKATKHVIDKTTEFLAAVNNDLVPHDLPQLDDGASTSAGHAFGQSDSDESNDDSSGICKAVGCNKKSLKHSESPDQRYDYCSLACLKADYPARRRRRGKQKSRTSQQINIFEALEMSQLQLLQEMDSITTGGSSSETSGGDTPSAVRRIRSRGEAPLAAAASAADTDPVLQHVLRLSQSAYTDEQDEELSLAIEMSLQSAGLHRRGQQTRPAATNLPGDALQLSSTPGSSSSSISNSTGSVRSESAQPKARSSSPHTSPATPGHRRRASRSRSDHSRDLSVRLDELDNAIAELLSVDQSSLREQTSLRRAESERRQHHTEPEASLPLSREPGHRPASVKRSKSERR